MWGSGYDKRTVLRATPATNVITGVGLGSRAVVLAAFDRGISLWSVSFRWVFLKKEDRGDRSLKWNITLSTPQATSRPRTRHHIFRRAAAHKSKIVDPPSPVRINKREDGFVRKVLFEATLAAVRFNPAVREIYRSLKENRKPEKVARIAAARKLSLIAHAVYRTGRPYRTFEGSGELTFNTASDPRFLLQPPQAVGALV